MSATAASGGNADIARTVAIYEYASVGTMSAAYALHLSGSGVQLVPLPKGVGRGSSCTGAARSCT